MEDLSSQTTHGGPDDSTSDLYVQGQTILI